MLEKRYKDHYVRIKPNVFPFGSMPESPVNRVIRKIKIPYEYDDFSLSTEYCSRAYPSSKWQSESREQYAGKSTDISEKPDFVITSLDARKHKPQTTQIFHINRINKKPVCTVQWINGEKDFSEKKTASDTEYSTSYKSLGREPRILVHKKDNDKRIDGSVVPLNVLRNNNVRSEMMLPVCDTMAMESAHNPHKYLLRKRKIPAPHQPCGVLYPSTEKLSTSLAKERPRSSLEKKTSDPEPPERVSLSSLSGEEFSRRKYIAPPPNHIKTGFDGGVPAKATGRFGDNLMPFMRVKSVF